MKKSGKKQVKKAKDPKKVEAAKKAWETIRAKAKKKNGMEGQKGWGDFEKEVRSRDKFIWDEYNHSFPMWERMVFDWGMKGAAKRIATMPESVGLDWLTLKTRLDLTIEAIITKQQYREIWEAEEKIDGVPYRELCTEKLRKYGWKGDQNSDKELNPSKCLTEKTKAKNVTSRFSQMNS